MPGVLRGRGVALVLSQAYTGPCAGFGGGEERGQKWAVTQAGHEGNVTGWQPWSLRGVNRFCLHFEVKAIGMLRDLTSIMRERGSLSGSAVKNPLAVQEAWVRSLGWDDPLEEGMEMHSSILAWSIPWTEEPGGLQYIGS